MPSLYKTVLLRDDLIVTNDYIVYIAEESNALLCNGDIPIDLVEDYAMAKAVSLGVHPNMRQFVAHQARLLVDKWQARNRCA